MDCYVALLRGINVGGKNPVRMNDLKECFLQAGFDGVSTYIQSGNVVFRSGMEQGGIMPAISSALKERLGIDVPVMVKSLTQMTAVVDQRPEGFGRNGGDFKYDVFFFSEGVDPREVHDNFIRARQGVDFITSGDHAIYVTRFRGELTKSFITKIISAPVYKNLTIRNWNTTYRLLEIMRECASEA